MAISLSREYWHHKWLKNRTPQIAMKTMEKAMLSVKYELLWTTILKHQTFSIRYALLQLVTIQFIWKQTVFSLPDNENNNVCVSIHVF